ncbi:hypothetical protein E4K39_10260 [Neisseria meningitidis]|jgi:hypothetical protein|uniref:Uncharacterized protein n=1 Tax=Neisseria meningitidis serogroup B (strain ATCC BAA-335 / MC58) TaxID=122586 RepID=Q9K066_NEIMB|nr:hypothetical protein NMB0754 [Neisseria meningitidis MC58]AVH82583.1 hypothetical protein A6J54_14375 [Neisseria meningitidis]AVH83230.1 hypothetical protein A6J50_13285 [Neisseria meningitidis]AVI44287.1 hypothetical protein A6J53_14635 [Neisseria meningitidis]AVI44627.1 hypothetical protein A6J49_13735 [Neisseria meningitidis]
MPSEAGLQAAFFSNQRSLRFCGADDLPVKEARLDAW